MDKDLFAPKRVLEKLNFDIVEGGSIRIMWSQRDPSLRRSGMGNLFIKNLPLAMDSRTLHKTFSDYGNILSCKVVTDEENCSKGFGFVHFETEESANKAILGMNGMIVDGKKVFVGKFIPRHEREKALAVKAGFFRNVYIKNFGSDLDDDKLKVMFQKYGRITSAKVMPDETGKSKGFGFVNFENPESAEKACEGLNGTELNGKTLYVGQAQKKSVRAAELKRNFKTLKMERVNRGVNLYVKNLKDSVDDERLRKAFSPFGTITSAKIMTDGNCRSRGFGFVCFSSQEEATEAIAGMNGKIVDGKPIYVALAQSKEDRKARLTSQYAQRMYNPGSAGYFVPTMPQTQQGYFPQMAQMVPGGQPAVAFQTMQTFPAVAAAANVPQGRPEAYEYTSYMRNPPWTQAVQQSATQQAEAQPAVHVQEQEPLTASMLADVDAEEQKQMLGESLYPIIHRRYPAMAAKLTGMLLKMENLDLLHLLEHPESLEPKIEEVVAVDAEEQKQMLGQSLYPIIHRRYPAMAAKLTGMLLEMENLELLHLLEHPESLKPKIEEAVAVLQAHYEKEDLDRRRNKGG